LYDLASQEAPAKTLAEAVKEIDERAKAKRKAIKVGWIEANVLQNRT